MIKGFGVLKKRKYSLKKYGNFCFVLLMICDTAALPFYLFRFLFYF